MTDFRTEDLPRPYWTWLVFVPLIVQAGALFVIEDREFYGDLFLGELGIVENLTAFLLLPAGALAAICGRRMWQWRHRAAGLLLYVFATGCLLFMGEEISWGQHYFGWSTPEFFLVHNESRETNLHNLESVHKGALKWVVIIGILVGGLLMPVLAVLCRHVYRPARHWIYWLIPTRICIPVVILIIVGHIAIKILRGSGLLVDYETIAIRIPENTELHIAMFFLLYTASLYKRVSQCETAAQTPQLVIGP